MIKKNISRLLSNQVARFVLVGGWNTVFGYLTFVCLYYLFSKTVHYMIILIISTLISISQAYVCHKFFVFKTSGNVLKEYLKFNSVYSVTAVINMILLPILVDACHWHPVFAQGFFIVLAASFSYFGHRRFTFKKARDAQLSVDQG